MCEVFVSGALGYELVEVLLGGVLLLEPLQEQRVGFKLVDQLDLFGFGLLLQAIERGQGNLVEVELGMPCNFADEVLDVLRFPSRVVELQEH